MEYLYQILSPAAEAAPVMAAPLAEATYAATMADSPCGSCFCAPSCGSALPVAAARRRDADHITRAGDITACQPAN
jgi:hypothetical protein